jgi:amino acid transporter
MTTLARKLRTFDYFALGFGTMVGVGWLVVMDDWLQRGGPAGAMLGFAVGGLALLPIGYVYGRLVMLIPDAGSEIAYTAAVFPREVSFATGWMMMLAYLIVCPWEAVAIGKVAAYVFPRLDSLPLYEIGGRPVFLPRLALGLGLALWIVFLNYRGIRLSADFQKWTTLSLLAIFAAFSVLGFSRGAWRNLSPPFTHGGFLSVLLVLQVVPYFMTGFEAAPKCAEEASPGFRPRSFFFAILAALLAGVLFYTTVIAVVTHLAPWPSLARERFITASAFAQAFRSRAVIDLVLLAAVLSLVKIFNGNFIAASRMVFALGRKGLIDARAGRVHPRFATPGVAVLAVGAVTLPATLLGDAILVPVTEVGSMTCALGWLAACAAYFRLQRRPQQRLLAVLGMAVAAILVLMKLAPFVPGHFTGHEWVALAAWIALGAVLHRSAGGPG